MDERVQRSLKKYGDIIRLDRPPSVYTPMDMDMRAAQFAPFEALTGLEDVMDDTADAHLEGVFGEIEREDFDEAP